MDLVMVASQKATVPGHNQGLSGFRLSQTQYLTRAGISHGCLTQKRTAMQGPRLERRWEGSRQSTRNEPETPRASEPVDSTAIARRFTKCVACVDDEFRLAQEPLAVQKCMVSDDDHRVDGGETRARIDAHELFSLVNQLRDVRVHVRELGPSFFQLAKNGERRRLANVANVRLVGDAVDQDLRAAHRE